MNTPVALVTAALTAAILLAVSFLIATGTRGENALAVHPATVLTSPAADMTAKRANPSHDHLWKMKNAPAAINAKPNP
jgi:hypothetical protein